MEKRRQRQSFELVFISKASLPNHIFTTDSLHHFQLSHHVGLVLRGVHIILFIDKQLIMNVVFCHETSNAHKSILAFIFFFVMLHRSI